MASTTHNPSNFSGYEGNQTQRVFTFFKENTATASMAERATGVHHKNICRIKRKLEKAGLLWQVCRGRCMRTGHYAFYLTTDPNKAPKDGQISLFDNE
ncbi:MAG: hypothetical protein HWD92_09155 [Flavobacteriia bacterium]|nr:hypothetical protein [Flavobacteriia bacterium]